MFKLKSRGCFDGVLASGLLEKQIESDLPEYCQLFACFQVRQVSSIHNGLGISHVDKEEILLLEDLFQSKTYRQKLGVAAW